MWLYHRLMSPKEADRMANRVDPDQTAPLGAVWSGSTLFAQAFLSENFGSLRYSTPAHYPYLPSGFVSPEVCKRCLEPLINFVQCQLFVFWFDDGLKITKIYVLPHEVLETELSHDMTKPTQNGYVPSKDSDQPGHPPSLIRVFALHMKKPWALSYPLSAQRRLWSDWADAQADAQADLSLRWAHTYFVGFVMSWLKSWSWSLLMPCVNSKDTDQPVYPCNLLIAFVEYHTCTYWHFKIQKLFLASVGWHISEDRISHDECNVSKICRQNDSVDPDQTAPLESTLFA